MDKTIETICTNRPASDDVFELIKYDILYHLLGFNWVKIDNDKFSRQLALQSYLMNNSVNVISKALRCVPVLANVGKIIDTISEIRKGYLKHEKEINENNSALLKEFYEGLKQQTGSIHEFDAISEFISYNLANCNVKVDEEERASCNDEDRKEDKKNVLIIDDLDRIDPEHIFRLLNVFSAHFDIDNNTNKFGFDKIIFVCDVENLKNIFAARYGQHTDFNGYINKFFSSKIFCYDNRVAISEFLEKVMNTNYAKCANGEININPVEIRYVTDILLLFVERGGISLRQIIANILNLQKVKVKQGVGTIGAYRNYCSGYTVIWLCIEILDGRKDVFISAIKGATLPSENRNTIKYRDIASIILPLLTKNIQNEIKNSNETIVLPHKEIGTLTFTLRKELGHTMYYVYADLQTQINFDTLKILLIEATDKLYKDGYLG